MQNGRRLVAENRACHNFYVPVIFYRLKNVWEGEAPAEPPMMPGILPKVPIMGNAPPKKLQSLEINDLRLTQFLCPHRVTNARAKGAEIPRLRREARLRSTRRRRIRLWRG